MTRIDDLAWVGLVIGWYAMGTLWLAAWWAIAGILG
jgi:hypothetical protein